jgi:hypothetical protein
VLQLEDCVDCLQALFPQFDFLFLFDHSNGHDRTKPDGLSTTRIRKRFGGKQPVMRDSKLTNTDCFGPYHTPNHSLQLNDTQHMVFTETDIGPFYLNLSEREKGKYDVRTGNKVKKYRIKEDLKQHLKEKGIINPSGSLKDIRAQCIALNVPIEYEHDNVKEGWVGKAKGALQVLFERGWVEEAKWKEYTTKGKKNEMGFLDKTKSLKSLMEKQSDFSTELTLLQYYAQEMGVKVDRTPKCHPEIAGEGIEYIWALAKLYYRMKPIQSKRTKGKFRLLVQECLSLTNLTKHSVRMSSRRAREYMLLYKTLHQMQLEQKAAANSNRNPSLPNHREPFNFNHELIEKTMKTYKSHRNAQDFDYAFIKNLRITDEKLAYIQEVVSKMKVSL